MCTSDEPPKSPIATLSLETPGGVKWPQPGQKRTKNGFITKHKIHHKFYQNGGVSSPPSQSPGTPAPLPVSSGMEGKVRVTCTETPQPSLKAGS